MESRPDKAIATARSFPALAPKARGLIACLAVAAEVGASLILVFVAALNLVNLALRYTVREGIPEATEASAIAVVVIGFLGMAQGFRDDSHVRFLIVDRWLRGRESTRGLVIALSLLTLAVLAYDSIRGTWAFAHLRLVAVSMPWLPFWIPELAIPLGAVTSLAVLIARSRPTSTPTQ